MHPDRDRPMSAPEPETVAESHRRELAERAQVARNEAESHEAMARDWRRLEHAAEAGLHALNDSDPKNQPQQATAVGL